VRVNFVGKDHNLLNALVDTGSPVNLIKKSTYLKFCGSNKLLRVNDNLKLKGINNSRVRVHGKIPEQICVENIKSYRFDIILLVVDDDTIVYDLLLGREFFISSEIKLIYQHGKYQLEFSSSVNTYLSNILPINAIESINKFDIVVENLDSHLSINHQNMLINLLEIDNMKIKKIEDDYTIRVHLKHTSLFRFSPRRMSFSERKILEEITD